jgi:2-dehydro-3-deoxyphosphooctonate aldolase (KDO 8-P synthase)
MLPPVQELVIRGVKLGGGNPLGLIAGPCVIESEDLTLEVAAELKKITAALGLPWIFKASFDKANRTSLKSFRGPGLEAGLKVLAKVGREFEVPLLTDVHEISQVQPAAEVVDVIQIPAFLSRQTDLIVAAAKTGRAVNLKKGQFLAPEDMGQAVAKAEAGGAKKIILTERGSSFGYHNLVVDMRGLLIMRQFGYPVVFDATHSVQLPAEQGRASGGDRRFIAPLARAAVAAGVDGIFLEVHPDPDRALCDGPNSLPLAELPALLRVLLDLHRTVGLSKL